MALSLCYFESNRFDSLREHFLFYISPVLPDRCCISKFCFELAHHRLRHSLTINLFSSFQSWTNSEVLTQPLNESICRPHQNTGFWDLIPCSFGRLVRTFRRTILPPFSGYTIKGIGSHWYVGTYQTTMCHIRKDCSSHPVRTSDLAVYVTGCSSRGEVYWDDRQLGQVMRKSLCFSSYYEFRQEACGVNPPPKYLSQKVKFEREDNHRRTLIYRVLLIYVLCREIFCSAWVWNLVSHTKRWNWGECWSLRGSDRRMVKLSQLRDSSFLFFIEYH